MSKREKSQRHLERNPVDLDILFDTGNRVSKAYGIIKLPTIVLVDAKGQIMNRWAGTRGLKEAKKALTVHFGSKG